MTEQEFLKFIDSQIDIPGLTAAIDENHRIYQLALAQEFDLSQYLKNHKANKPTTYSYNWVKEHGEIIKCILACREVIDQSRGNYLKAQTALVEERRRVVAKLRTRTQSSLL